ALEGARVGEGVLDHTGLAQMVIAGTLMFQGESEQALEKLDNLVIRRPTCDVTYAVEGSIRRYMGDWEKSVDLLDKAMRLTAANNPWYPTVQACALFLGGRIEQAASTAEAVIEHQPSNLEALLVLVAAQVEMGLERRARATAELVRERFPSVDVDRWLTENPYQKREMVERWKIDLATVGVFD
ncbi:MAG: tetratricopeptide repeat protein, partial [Acidimicrobiia bacterium]